MNELNEVGITIQNQTQGLDLSKPTNFYCGFDATASSLHVGHLFMLKTISRMAKCGHYPSILIGDATALIGDPSGRDKERETLDCSEDNAESIREQVDGLLSKTGVDFYIVKNSFWLDRLHFLDVLHKYGNHFRVNEMLSKSSVENRLSSDEGMSLKEFMYQVIQAMDFEHLYKTFDCTLQIGGSDQWGNITAGASLVRKIHGKQVHGLTFPLLMDSNGNKMSKTGKGGTIWLDPDLTSPFDFYQFWLNQPDSLIPNLLSIASGNKDEYNHFLGCLSDSPEKREAQKFIAKNLTSWVHNELFSEASESMYEYLSTKVTSREIIAEVFSKYEHILPSSSLDSNFKISSVLVSIGLATSLGDARRKIKGNGISINKIKITKDSTLCDIMDSGIGIIQSGKQNLHLIRRLK